MGKENHGYISMKREKLLECIKHYGKYVMCIVIGAACYLVAETLGQKADFVESGRLYRNPCGQGEAPYKIYVDGLEESFLIELFVPEQELSEEQFQEALPEMADTLMERMVGENPSLQEVYLDLNLVKELPEYGVEISWQSECPEIVGNDGMVCAEETAEVYLEATLSNGIYSEVLEIPIQVFPTQASLEERFRLVLEDVIQQNPEQEDVLLPTEFEGKKVQYRSSDEASNGILLLLGIAAAVCMYLKEKEDISVAKKVREEQLMEDYPEFVYQLLILIGAGYSAKAAWKKLTESYEEDKGTMNRPLRKEMQVTMNQIETGVPEVRAYIEFGRRCGNRKYMKFASLLESSISTGGKNLRKLLEDEVKESFEMRAEIARRKGEEASAKLLLPSFVMLSVVMVMVMAPAFLTIL